MSLPKSQLKAIIEAVLLSATKPMTVKKIQNVFTEQSPDVSEIQQAISELQSSYADNGFELVEVASGFQYQAKQEYAPWLQAMLEEKPAKYSRALLETLALIAYRQPITRGEIEQIRGVSVSSSIIRTLQEEREWIRVVGHKDVPGKPGLYATTKQFLDYFGFNSLEQLPSLPELLIATELEKQQLETV